MTMNAIGASSGAFQVRQEGLFGQVLRGADLTTTYHSVKDNCETWGSLDNGALQFSPQPSEGPNKGMLFVVAYSRVLTAYIGSWSRRKCDKRCIVLDDDLIFESDFKEGVPTGKGQLRVGKVAIKGAFSLLKASLEQENLQPLGTGLSVSHPQLTIGDQGYPVEGKLGFIRDDNGRLCVLFEEKWWPFVVFLRRFNIS